eukprot:c33265_g1_i1 orf=76-228(+)
MQDHQKRKIGHNRPIPQTKPTSLQIYKNAHRLSASYLVHTKSSQLQKSVA